MRPRNSTGRIGGALLSAAILTGCGIAQSPAADSGAEVLVIGIDVSGSYRDAASALEAARSAVARAPNQSIDVVAVRWISEASYSGSAAVLYVEVPRLAVNPFDPRSIAARDSVTSALRTEAGGMSLPADPAALTDVVGFFSAVADLHAELSRTVGVERMVVRVFTDAEDTRGFELSRPLAGVVVEFVLTPSSDDPSEVESLRERWRTALTDAGAESVHFLTPKGRTVGEAPHG